MPFDRMHSLDLVRELVAVPAPPGQEDRLREVLARHLTSGGWAFESDARGNLLVAPRGLNAVPTEADIVVMAHMDEIAMLVVRVEPDGTLIVTNMGGLYPWKCGEGPVVILAPDEDITGILSFGSIHTNAPESIAVKAREHPLAWSDVRVWTGRSAVELAARGVRPGTRVCIHPSRRVPTQFGDFVASPFLDDRADLAAWLLVMEAVSERGVGKKRVVFAATAAEEVGGHGALYLLRQLNVPIGIALEVGPRLPENPFVLDAQPTVWVDDGYSATQPRDIALVARAANEVGQQPHWQALSRGGSDASCAASHGLLARPITLAFAAENSHGYEIMHQDAVVNLAHLTLAVLDQLDHE